MECIWNKVGSSLKRFLPIKMEGRGSCPGPLKVLSYEPHMCEWMDGYDQKENHWFWRHSFYPQPDVYFLEEHKQLK